MVSQKYRWDFIGLSTDTKPTSETSDKVVNGSTYYCSDTSKLYVYCDGTWYERKPLGGGGGGGTSDFNDLSNRPKYNGTTMTGTTDIPEVKTYTAGTNVTISDQNVISATDTTYSDFTGTDGTSAGTAGLVPAPTTSDTDKYLKSDGSWATVSGGSGPTVVQTTGTSTTDVMSQNATTSMVFADPGTNQKVQIGASALASGTYSSAIGGKANATATASLAIGTGYDTTIAGGRSSIALGTRASSPQRGSIALGSYSGGNITAAGMIDVGTGDTSDGYNSSNYRLLTGLYDGQSAHDAATKGQLDAIAIKNAGAPTTATVGTVGQLLEDTTNGKLYICTAIVPGTDPDPDTYTWVEVGAGGGSGPTVVQTTGTSTTDVMSQNAVTSMVFADPDANPSRVRIGMNASNNATGAVAIGSNANTSGDYAVAMGGGTAGARCSVCFSGGTTTSQGVFQLGLNKTGYTTYGYNNSQYRLLSGLYDGQSAHDAATLAQGNTLSTSAPTTSTVGVLGQLYTDTTNMHTYQCTAISGNTYTWTQRW